MEINEMLEVTTEEHQTLGRIIVVKAKLAKDGGAPFFVNTVATKHTEETIDPIFLNTEVGIRLSEASAAKLAHYLMKTVAEPQE